MGALVSVERLAFGGRQDAPVAGAPRSQRRIRPANPMEAVEFSRSAGLVAVGYRRVGEGAVDEDVRSYAHARTGKKLAGRYRDRPSPSVATGRWLPVSVASKEVTGEAVPARLRCFSISAAMASVTPGWSNSGSA